MPKAKDNKDNIEIKRLTHRDIIIENIENVLLLISNNVCYVDIAKQLGVAKTALVDTLNLEDYRARKRTALECAADMRVEKAEQYLQSIRADDTNATVKKKIHLYHHEIYIAKVKCPEKYELNYKNNRLLENNETGQIVIMPSDEALQLLNEANNKNNIANKDNIFISDNTSNNISNNE
jgi:hypothetical protein